MTSKTRCSERIFLDLKNSGGNLNMNIFNANYRKNQIQQKDWFDFEKQFLMPLSLAAIFFSGISVFLNIIMGFNWELIVVPFVGITIFFIIFLMARYNYHVDLAKWLFIVTTLVLINIVWYYNFGARGPWFFIVILLYSYLIFMMSGKQLLILSIVLVLNVIALFIFEYNHPNALGDYKSNTERLLDFYSAILLKGATAYILMSIAKRSYLTQYKKAKMADKLKSSFLANMSHEIRTPLNAIVGFSNLLADETLGKEERDEYISIINNSSDTLLQLVNDILDVSMIEANQVTINKKDFSVNELMKILEKTYIPILKEKRQETVQLKLNIPKKIFRINSDQIRINQMMVNLLNNAIKFTNKGFIEFGFTLEGAHLNFYVKDTGIGIEQTHLDHLFERFYKIEDDNRKLYRGTGIGLYLCKKIAEMLGGSIHVSSEYGKGSVFSFSVPAESLVIEQSTGNNKSSNNLELDNLSPDNVVLIVEDDMSSLIYFKKILQGINLKILEAADGKEGMEIFTDNKDISVVLLDIQLPGISGFEILKEMKKIRPDVPVIAQTAFAMADDKEKCIAAGFDDYISKPVSKDTLIKKLQKFI